MNRTTTYRWAAATAATAAALAVLTALAAPFATTAPASPTTRPVASSTTQPSPPSQPTVDRSVAAAARAAVASTPSVVASIKPTRMSSAFDSVTVRSIFLKGEQRIGRSGRDDGPRSFLTAPPYDPRANLVFRGFTQNGDRTDAMIEDTGANKIFSVRVGELLAGGRVLAIGFDTLDYQYGGKLTRVALGQTLEGTAASVASTDPPTTAPSPGGPVDAAPPLGTTAGMSAEDILARMKKRRQMEMGGK